ncbi:MAG: LAGLIDADG family homing endonuclease [Candidatus Bathyarchaeia archaeon]
MTWKFKKVANIDPDILDQNLQYIAGLMDGEGTFAIRITGKDNHHFTPMIEISMSHEESIRFVANIFGVSYDKVRAKEKYHKDMYRVLVTTEREIRQIAEALLPYSITKKEQIELLLEFSKLKDTFPGGKYDSRCKEILLEMIDVFIELKKRNVRGKPPNYEAIRKHWRLKLLARVVSLKVANVPLFVDLPKQISSTARSA